MKLDGTADAALLLLLLAVSVDSLPAEPVACDTSHPFARVTACEGSADRRGPDPRFAFSIAGRPKPDRCRSFFGNFQPAELLDRGWQPASSRFLCDRIGLSGGEMTCRRFERTFDATQVYVEGYDRNCSNGVVLKISNSRHLNDCLAGRVPGAPVPGVTLDQNSYEVTNVRWRGPGYFPFCRWVETDELTVPSYRLDVVAGAKVGIGRSRGPRSEELWTVTPLTDGQSSVDSSSADMVGNEVRSESAFPFSLNSDAGSCDLTITRVIEGSEYRGAGPMTPALQDRLAEDPEFAETYYELDHGDHHILCRYEVRLAQTTDARYEWREHHSNTARELDADVCYQDPQAVAEHIVSSTKSCSDLDAGAYWGFELKRIR